MRYLCAQKNDSTMSFSTFVHDTPLWLLIVLGLCYAAVAGYALWLIAALLRRR